MRLRIHLKPICRIERVLKMLDRWLGLLRGPADGEHIESRGMLKQAARFQVVESQARESLLFAEIDGMGRLLNTIVGDDVFCR